jgi:SAM-dependent methyltransferase
MPTVDLSYVDSALEFVVDGEEQSPFWRAFHWGLFDDPAVEDDSPERYYRAGEAMTEHIVTAAGVEDGRALLDVGCGFGGTLDHIATRNSGCRLAGLNIDERQLRQAKQLLGAHGRGIDGSVPLIAADGCRLPVADASLDHVLAVECIFHFPSRKAFFREAARVLRPGGTLALSDFVIAPGGKQHFLETAGTVELGNWFGHSSPPITSKGYATLARAVGLEVLVDDDVSERTYPTYPALRRLYDEVGSPDAVTTINGCEVLAREGGWQYHVIAFRKLEA